MADIKVTLDQSDDEDLGQPGLEGSEEDSEQPSRTHKFKTKLVARRTLDGNIIVSDHPDIDIVILPDNMKVITFAKNNFDDTVYEAQNNLMKHLFKKGVIVYDSIASGNVYGSLEAKIQKPKQEFPIDNLMIMLISDWINEQKPSVMYQKSIEDTYVDNLTDPEQDNSTELGDIPAASEKGSVPIHQVRRYAYGL